MQFKQLPSNVKPFYKLFRHKKEYGDRDIRGYDTETAHNGDLLVLADDKGSTGLRPSIDKRIKFLVKNEANVNKKLLNFFFNLGFDTDTIFKPLANQIQLNKGSWKLKYGKYTITYLSKKLLRIQYSHHIVEYWDLANFLSGSLESLANKYLGDTKDDKEIIDKNHMENVDFNIMQKYCIKDALLTKKLGEWLFNHVEDFSLKILGRKASPTNWYSKATLSEFYLKKIISVWVLKPRYSLNVLDYAYKTYHGGLFECYVKGPVHETTIDINSAYPSEIMNLVNLNRGEWVHVNTFQPNAYYGFYHVRIRYNGYIPYMFKNRIYYPVTKKRYEYYATQNELKEFGDFEILDGYVWYPYKIEYPFRDLINKLFALKAEAKVQKDEPLYWLTKVILNGIYGKFVQTAGDRVGSLFNPVYGAIITANTRLKIYRAVKRYFNEVYSIDTDSITGKLKENINMQEFNEDLGNFGIKGESDKIIIMNGISINSKGEFLNSRGFSRAKVNNYIKDDDKITISLFRPKHLRECLKQKNIKLINSFNRENRIVNLNEGKRIFAGKFEWNKLLHSFAYGDEFIV